MAGKAVPVKPQTDRWAEYRNGGEGFIKFVEDNMRVQIYPVGKKVPKWVSLGDLPDTKHPETGRSYRFMWEKQKEVARKALVMDKKGEFKHRLIIFCWPRGDGKSFMVVAIIIWKFFCFPQQDLVLCANSKDQSTFVHLDEIKKYVQNSPNLLALLGKKNILQKGLRIMDKNKNPVSKLWCGTTFTGIFSNVKGYTFSEFFDLKNEHFFAQIDGSIRNMPNAFGLIDTTVSTREHKLYHLWDVFQKGLDKTLFFSYRYSKTGDPSDYWNPYMTKDQLDSYRAKEPFRFGQYFLNLWSAGAENVFTPIQVESVYYLGVKGSLVNHKKLIEILERRQKIDDGETKLISAGLDGERYDHIYVMDRERDEIERSLWPADNEYRLSDDYANPRCCTLAELSHLSELYDTDWAILAGIDRADPFKRRTNARTIVAAVAKGLPGSRTNPRLGTLETAEYVYILVHLKHIEDSTLEGIKDELREIHEELDGIDTLCSERWGIWDMKDWCEEEGIPLESFQSSQSIQLSVFTEFYNLVDQGRFKSARVTEPGSRDANILAEEMGLFDYDPEKRSFGSPEKKKKHGVQDDAMFSVGYAIYGGRLVTADEFRKRGKAIFFGALYKNEGLLGRYS